ncbi:tyrosine protein phosphatase LTP1 [Ascoidea rubescens DSM 1968]|uniref:LMWPc-domain-containing protein n=1 Tax=Ascoidea rubescens DSM 1968 TaxID=1344418 RepID=A0A1D2VD08_9ASCO|nr:LMWPc-domain-containing protein [Ascoidea rubescens DSM 1968]ODV59584.1 LMWPc-domain-containing protein [Ascoidea rubescens DSM 1968]
MPQRETLLHQKISVAFVCLGNICRSPMAEAIFKHIVKQKGLHSHFDKIDSFGTAAYHIGELPDYRSEQTCLRHHITVDHRAQKIAPKHFEAFDFIFAMDNSNLSNLKRIQPKHSKAHLSLFGKYNEKSDQFPAIVDDPYYGGINGFEFNFQQISHFTEVFLKNEITNK